MGDRVVFSYFMLGTTCAYMRTYSNIVWISLMGTPFNLYPTLNIYSCNSRLSSFCWARTPLKRCNSSLIYIEPWRRLQMHRFIPTSFAFSLIRSFLLDHSINKGCLLQFINVCGVCIVWWVSIHDINALKTKSIHRHEYQGKINVGCENGKWELKKKKNTKALGVEWPASHFIFVRPKIIFIPFAPAFECTLSFCRKVQRI